jgi:predicted RNase H-like HicB family nuclease
MRKYLVIIEEAGANLSAYSPDLPGCVATGRDLDEVRLRMAEAIRFHLDGLREDGLELPEPSARAEFIPVP